MFWPLFPRFIDCERPHGTIYKCPHAFLTFTVEIISAFFGPKRLLITQIFEKKAKFPVKKIFWPIFARNMELDKCQGTIYKGPQGILTIILQMIGNFFGT